MYWCFSWSSHDPIDQDEIKVLMKLKDHDEIKVLIKPIDHDEKKVLMEPIDHDEINKGSYEANRS